MNQDFTDRHVVVTGGTGALGCAVVTRLLAAGATCHIPALEPMEVERAPFADHPAAFITHPVDLTDDQATEAFYRALPSLWASIHCAGGFAMAPIVETSAASLRHLLAMNVETCFSCCRYAVARIREPGVPESHGGRIVNVAARPALEPRSGAGMVTYTAAKAAVGALTESLAEEVAGEGIWVNAIAPSLLDSPANRAAMPDADHSVWPSVAAVAETIVHLASPANGASRGAVVPVYGRV